MYSALCQRIFYLIAITLRKQTYVSHCGKSSIQDHKKTKKTYLTHMVGLCAVKKTEQKNKKMPTRFFSVSPLRPFAYHYIIFLSAGWHSGMSEPLLFYAKAQRIHLVSLTEKKGLQLSFEIAQAHPFEPHSPHVI